jgi:UDP-N-acetylmuramate-alanine ligase
MIVPADEVLSVATISDKEKLKDKPFFASSENGDKLLVFANAKKAIIYRESQDKVVDVLTVDFNATTNSTESTTPDTTAKTTFCENFTKAFKFIKPLLNDQHIVVFMGAGDIDERLRSQLS